MLAIAGGILLAFGIIAVLPQVLVILFVLYWLGADKRVQPGCRACGSIHQ